MHVALLTYGINKESYYEEQYDKEVVIGHLHVVGINLKRRKDTRYGKSSQIFTLVGKQYACYHWGQVGKCHDLPYMTGCYDNEEITAESPYHGAKRCKIPAEIEGAQHDIEAEKIGKDIPYILGQPQVVCLHDT